MPYSICPHCGGDIVLYRQINGNGAHVIVARCCKCDRIPNRKQPFLPKADYPHWEQFPLYQDNMKYSDPCAVSGCDRRDTEYHHWAPKAVFGYEEAEQYPGAYLCQYHHDHWHELTQTGKWTKRKNQNGKIPA